MSRSDNFNKIIESVTSKLEGDNAQEIKSELRQCSALFEDTIASLSSFGSENKEKRLEIQKLEKGNRELRVEMDSVKTDFDEYKGSQDTSEIDSLRTFKAEVLAQNKATFIKQLESITEHSNFSKAREFFDIPDANEEGAYNFSDLTDEQMEHNMSEMDKLNKLGYFENSSEETTTEAESVSQNKAYGKSTPKPADFNSQIDSATTMEELEKLNNNII